MWNPLNWLGYRKDVLQIIRALRAIISKMESIMSALDDLKAASAANDAGIQHVVALLTEAADKLKSNPDEISGDEIEEIANHLAAGAATLNGLTLVPVQTSGVPGSTTANQAPTSATDAPTPPTTAPSAS